MLAHINTWVFDLDNTLYPKHIALYTQINTRISDFMISEIGMDREQADIVRRRMFKAHGSTLLGLMHEYKISPKPFLDFVHDVDLSEIAPSPELDDALRRLPGQKLIFTNSIGSYSERILQRIGIRDHFLGIQDLYASQYMPKPAAPAYQELIARFGIEPSTTAMIDDMARNLAPAAELGLTTIWIKGGPFPDDGGHASAINHTADELLPWLNSGPAASSDRTKHT